MIRCPAPKVAELSCVDIYGVAFMDNHFYLIVSALIGTDISGFMDYFQNIHQNHQQMPRTNSQYMV